MPQSCLKTFDGRTVYDPEGMNDSRADWALKTLNVFQKLTGTDDEDILSDLLCNLRHWCDRAGIDFDAALDRSTRCYQDEVMKVEQ